MPGSVLSVLLTQGCVISIIFKRQVQCPFCSCYGLDPECPPKAHVLKPWSPRQQCSEVKLLGTDWTMKALISSMDPSIDVFITEWITGKRWNCRKLGLLRGRRSLTMYLEGNTLSHLLSHSAS